MTALRATAAGPNRSPASDRPLDARYEPGVCNIGPDEVARRRRAGQIGLAATILLFALLLVAHAPAIARLLLFVPAAGAAIGYLQAWFRFCAGFGSRGVFNFGALGRTWEVGSDDARANDRTMALRLAMAAAAIGLLVAVVAVILPL